MSFSVHWDNEFQEQKTPLEAAKQALQDLHNGETLMFTVIDKFTNKRYLVDLSLEDGDAVHDITIECIR